MKGVIVVMKKTKQAAQIAPFPAPVTMPFIAPIPLCVYVLDSILKIIISKERKITLNEISLSQYNNCYNISVVMFHAIY